MSIARVAGRGRRPRLMKRSAGVMAVVLAIGLLAPNLPAATAADPTFSITPTTGVIDDQPIAITGSGLASGVTYVIVECGPDAISILSGHRPDGDINPEDGCDAQSAMVRFTGNGSTVRATMNVHVWLNAAVGSIDCRSQQCFIALFPLAGSAPLHVQNLTFAPNPCAAAGSCVPGTRPGQAGASSPRAPQPTPAPSTIATATASTAVTLGVDAGIAGDLRAPGAILGPVTGAFGAPNVPATPVSGQGIIRLDLAAPGTDWGANTPSAIVADVAVDGGTTQQMVLFNGATPFVYAGGLGSLTTGPHTVHVSVDGATSHPGSGPARIDIHDLQLLVVDPSNARYDTLRYAPIIWGRSTSALHDTPLIEYGSTVTNGTAKSSSYTMVFSHEDSGTAFIPFMESAVWGRMTDIESFFTVHTDATGTPTDGTFLSGNTPDDYPDTQNAISEPTVSYTSGNWVGGTHGVVRVATGNNDFSQNGTTAFRLRPVPVDAPAPGEPREAVMDANPWTYRIVGEEVARWYTNVTTDPALPEQGDARQYATVQLDTSGSGVQKVAIDVQLDGSDVWYANDFGSGYATGGTGTDRTVIKLPVDWMDHAITAVRVRVFPPSGSSLTVSQVKMWGLDANWNFRPIELPTPRIVPGFLFTMAQLAPPATSTTTTASSSPPTSTSISPVDEAPVAIPETGTPRFTG